MTTYTFLDLFALEDEWEATFGESLSYGFNIGPNDVPLLQRCLAAKSKQELKDHIDKQLAQGKVF